MHHFSSLIASPRLLGLVVLLFLSGLTLVPEKSFAQEELLPTGVGLYQFGYRGYAPQTQKYNNQGELEGLGKPFSNDFTGDNLQQGVGGAELKRLADELAKYDSFANTQDSLVNQLDLGTMTGSVEANIEARIVGMAFGLGKNLSFFVGAPYIEAEVNAEIDFQPRKADLDAIKERLGDVAFDEIKDGLVRAGNINSAQIKGSIEGKGYAPIDHWAHSGWGDIQFGPIIGNKSRRKNGARLLNTLKTTINVPTGYYEDPDILTDVSLGKGYWGLMPVLSQSYLSSIGLWGGYSIGAGYNFATQVDKRVPEANEGIVARERKTTVDFAPGHDLEYSSVVGLRLGVVRAKYRLGQKKHYRDQFSGSLAGNYAKLGENTNSEQSYQEATLAFQTMDLYRQKKFPIPFMLELTGHFPIAAINSQNETYYEARIASFFSTPMAKKSKRNLRRQQRLKRAKNRGRKNRLAHHH